MLKGCKGTNPCAGFEAPGGLPFKLPNGLDDMNKEWMTQLLRHRGMIKKHDTIIGMEESGVGMTAGYFSAIKKLDITFSAGTPASCPTKYVVKAWPSFELLPKESIKTMFINDIKGYSDFSAEDYYPRPDVYLSTYDEDNDLYALVVYIVRPSSYFTHQTLAY